MQKLFSSILLVVSFSLGLNAQTIERHLNEIIVEAQAAHSAIEQQKEALPSKIVISAKDMNNFGHHTVGDVLKRLPRIFIQGPPSFNRNIMMGGLDKQYQSVLINGNRPAGGEDYRDLKLDRIPVDMIEEIEIIYNPPAEWGADAAMGVVNIKLKSTPEKRMFTANVATDHTSTDGGMNPDLSLTYGNSLGKLSFIASYSYNQFNRTNLNSLADEKYRGTESEDLNVNIHGLTGTINYKISKNKSLKLETFFSNYHEDVDFLADVKRRTDGTLNTTADTATDVKLRRLHTHTLTFETKGDNWKWTNAINFGENIDRKDRWRMTAKSDGLTESFEKEDQVNSEGIFRSDYRLQLNKQNLKAGLRASAFGRDYTRWVYTRIDGHKYWDDITDGSYTLEEYRAGAYLTDEITLKRLFLVPSVRFDYDTRSYKTTTDKGNYHYSFINPSLHAKYQVNDGLFLKGDIARQISRPPFNQQVPVDKIKNKKSTIERGNNELKPSISYNMNAGVEKYFNKDNYITLRGYYSIIRDVIENKNIGIDSNYGYQIIQAVNVDSARVWGIDVDTRVELFQTEDASLAFNGNFSWMDSEVRDATSGKLRRLNEQPEWVTNASIDYLNTKLKIQFSLGVNHVAKRYLAGGTDEETSTAVLTYLPFTQWDARLKYFVKPWGSIFVNSVNLFNDKMETQQAGVTESEVIGRNVRIGINITL